MIVTSFQHQKPPLTTIKHHKPPTITAPAPCQDAMSDYISAHGAELLSHQTAQERMAHGAGLTTVEVIAMMVTVGYFLR